MASKSYRNLSKQITILKRSLLPRDLKADILDLSPRISVRALSFRLLAHAEIEEYFEARAQEVSGLISTRWKTSRHVSYPTACMLAFSGQSMAAPPETVSKPADKQGDWADLIRMDGRLSRAMSSYYYYVNRQNNGINEENLVRMLLPIGFDIVILDEAVLLQFNNFAKLRGEAAHKSSGGHVTQGVNPKDECKLVEDLLEALKPIDDELSRLVTIAS